MKWVLIDSNNLIHRVARALYSSMGKVPVELAIINILDQLKAIGKDLKSNRFALFFDSTTNRRKEIFTEYKSGRNTNLDRMYARAVYKVLKQIRPILRSIGFELYECVGFEADDLVAQAARWLDRSFSETGVIVSSDSDLQQCISEFVEWYDFSRRKRYNLEQFTKEVGSPKQFAMVKAIAGCSSDSVPGVPGVGPVTAWKWLRGEAISDARRKAIESSPQLIDRNMRLVKLPLDGTPEFNLKVPCYKYEALEIIRGLDHEADLSEWSVFLRGRLSLSEMQSRGIRTRKESACPTQ